MPRNTGQKEEIEVERGREKNRIINDKSVRTGLRSFN